MTVTVGITGGIGSGKSTVCHVFKLLRVPVFEADIVAKQLINSNAEIRSKLIHLFGEGIYTIKGLIDRKKLADIIFNNDFQLAKINELVHPFVKTEFRKWLKMQKSPYVIHEAAILFESGFYKMMDFTILITAPESQRIERVVKRGGVNAAELKNRINKQWTDSEKRELADIEIENDNKNLIIPKIIQIDKNIKEHGKIW
ncbi:MAG: dephospho-CoA kinase [Prolixibacteraceae bacterium]|jgi:dephospho-CoA kinase|nr:dephospho-CoA kinase [Prolixibacteraceae bacterium]MBT6005330.1 dephospho-CoA kinase [Prolixibacteraceae bacterium]MBT6766737.1 dephospho-CoA kinase [Prolixibacteraceae bacterium]MBT6999568.1 dephospho-CoA kinase [Prolixibacteraceae bacterium]MBT7395352.1 dephospho-CoA kinase [Prolixibacteraceae bacterium]